MDFRSLSRIELQVLCKKNKIPANLTNVAMADSLEALETVEGMDELLQMCESPCVPPTGGRSTRRRNTETPAAAQTNMRKGQTENNDALLTPAPSGVTSRIRIIANEVTALKQVRRSARLAEKSARLLKGSGNENPDLLKKGLFADDCDESKVKSQDGLDEVSGVTDVSEDDTERRDDEQVDSAENNNWETDDGIKSELKGSSSLKINEGGAGSESLDLRDVEATTIVMDDEEEVLEVVPCEKDVSTEESVDIEASETDIQVKITQEDNTDAEIECKVTFQSEGTVDVQASETEEDITTANTDTTVSEDKIVVKSEGEDVYHEEYIDLGEKPNNGDDSSETESESESESSTRCDSLAAMPSDMDETNASSGDENENNLLIYKDHLPLASNDPTEAVADNLLPISMKNFPSYSTPVRASARKNRVMSAASDNKENIGRNKMLKEISRTICKMDDQSVSKLSKKLKEKVDITPKLDKSENEVSATARPALQVLPDNK